MKGFSLKALVSIFKNSFKGFSEDKVPKLGGSLAYFTIFSLGPMLLLVIFLAGIFLGRQAVEGSLFNQVRQLVGPSTATQVQQLVKNASVSQNGGTAAIIGVIALVIGATSVFTEIQDSINTIWRLKMKTNSSWKSALISRLLSFGLVAGIGFLLLVSLAASALMEGLGAKVTQLVPGLGLGVMHVLTYAFTLLISVLLFAIIFKLLPAASLRWPQVWPGAITTALLFMIGRFLISIYISKSDLGNTFGAAGSLVVLLVWVYYSSLILYFGAEFIKAYSSKFAIAIRPKKFATSTEGKQAAVN